MLNISWCSPHKRHCLFRYFQMSTCFACLVDVRTFDWGKLFSAAPSLWGCVNQLFQIIPSQQDRAVGKWRQSSLPPQQNLDIRKLLWRTWSLKGLCKVITPTPSRRRSHLSKERSHSPLSSHPSLSALFLITSQQRSGSPSHLLTFPKWYIAGHIKLPQGLSILAESREAGTQRWLSVCGNKVLFCKMW